MLVTTKLIHVSDAESGWLYNNVSKTILFVFRGPQTFIDAEQYPEAAAALLAHRGEG